MATTTEQAQTAQDREREAYWASKKETHPKLREMIQRDDIRHITNRGRFLNGKPIKENRADRRAQGHRSNYSRSPFHQSHKAAPREKP